MGDPTCFGADCPEFTFAAREKTPLAYHGLAGGNTQFPYSQSLHQRIPVGADWRFAIYIFFNYPSRDAKTHLLFCRRCGHYTRGVRAYPALFYRAGVDEAAVRRRGNVKNLWKTDGGQKTPRFPNVSRKARSSDGIVRLSYRRLCAFLPVRQAKMGAMQALSDIS